jgi:2,3,4,5-tetrahydropyridine-2-carboxylate N-succinyltransferase
VSAVALAELERRVEALHSAPKDAPPSDAEETVLALLDALERGAVRAAARGSDGRWSAVGWVKRGILAGFRIGRLVDQSPADSPFRFFDKHTFPTRAFTLADQVRIVPGGTTVRRGAYVAPGVVCMPPVYVNVGSWVGAGTMVDSHALVGSCAQIGERVHLSAARRQRLCSLEY